MQYSYVARQEILDLDKNTIAYELLFRDGPDNFFPDVEAELATNLLLSEHFFINPGNILDNKLGFVNFPYQSLINKTPTLFPKNKIVVEILEDCLPTDELFDSLQSLSNSGYVLALDDFIPSSAWNRFYPFISIIKLDITTISIEESALFINQMRTSGSNIRFLAEKVETYEEYEHSISAGFNLFQGYFFSKPEMLKQTSISSSFLTKIKLCEILSKSTIDYKKVKEIVISDVTLSYKLLHYVNSSIYIRTEIKSFSQALAYLGENKLRRFLALAVLSSGNIDKPNSLFTLSIQRARFCESLAECSGKNTCSAFLTGIFSLLDSLLDRTLEDILSVIPVDKDIKEALLLRTGDQGNILSLVIAYERANWDDVFTLKEILNVPAEILLNSYEDSIIWANDLLK